MTTSGFERHAQTALVLLLVALLLWVGQTTQSTAVTVAEMRIEVAYLKAASEHDEKWITLSKRVDELQNRLYLIEKEVIERRVREKEKEENL